MAVMYVVIVQSFGLHSWDSIYMFAFVKFSLITSRLMFTGSRNRNSHHLRFKNWRICH